MRTASTLGAAIVAVALLASPALAFDVQQSGGHEGSGSANFAPDVGGGSSGVSIDTDLRSQLGLAESKAAEGTARTGLQFSGDMYRGASRLNPSSMGFDERPWVVPRSRAGRD
ncbi:hypothetical protein [Hyphomicrobium sulfonivorans]|uniref:hypothetical protein n=1 Tax=Hyphomicrobium sulfonivorans TaxID=121290 RepID=UPI0012EEBDC8|nr:hypothetical protein [Hyphomicrobium sulfonivorans]MBI1650790.1 hypothetical protein [Hyphomicrobium sulfonivorans]NSL71853.1 hypothetical protein [Hyphomicrobium sulfonivorans]